MKVYSINTRWKQKGYRVNIRWKKCIMLILDEDKSCRVNIKLQKL